MNTTTTSITSITTNNNYIKEIDSVLNTCTLKYFGCVHSLLGDSNFS